MPENYSPKLKEVMAEIKAVLDRHDIAAYVLLQEPGFSEYLLSIEPSWSALYVEKDATGQKEGIGLHATREMFDTAEEHRQVLEDTLNLLVHLSDVLGKHQSTFAFLRDMVESKLEAEHTGGTHTPHRKH